jgi:capsular polysaccharide biosynthesis protein
MDLLNFARTLWRHRWWTLPLVMLTVVAVGYVALAADRTYEARADLVLIGPPGPPSVADMEADPTLANARLDNPYARAFDPTVITEIVARVVAADRDRGELPSGYRIDSARRYGSAAPLVEISARASDPLTASTYARDVSNRFVDALQSLQAAEQVHPRSLITTRPMDTGQEPREVLTQRLRAIVGVAALGALILIIFVTTAQAIGEHRRTTRMRTIPTLDPAARGSSVVELQAPSAGRT